jgi:hypothetical protein
MLPLETQMTLDTVIEWLENQQRELEATINSLKRYREIESQTTSSVRELLSAPSHSTPSKRSEAMKKAWRRRKGEPQP